MHLELEGVSYGVDGTRILSDVSLAVEPGEVVTIIGPSGAGKTTLLRLASLFERPTDGAVRSDGTDPWSLPRDERLTLRRRIGVVFQQASLFATSVARNVDAGRRIRRPWSSRVRDFAERLASRWIHGSPTVDDRTLEALELVGLREEWDRAASSLSGGEAQRVSFARALAPRPDLLVLDEPTSDLDPRNTAILERAIERARGHDHGVLLATHDMHQAERISDRVAFLLEGELIEVGSPERVFDTPRDERTARFVRGDLLYDENELLA
ncbi:phosphate ABC transporter ATP-binding protein [Natrinema longum]|uniref:Phosphate ABC transporter ATP-binding protein n=1 Tax=Natrinema longum TaxID=370324 RepID=A0A8A2U9J8_9EURY|nr:phosphate ABC transporter ATP-binding protein [Natrinema longum]MBZ6493584.1 phosphate ABC transporter ATP-binding protein [Natrinema longum]QSW85072.1 phosphate ABC transporter ATP-binding protein [Natrinema longum]